MFAEQLRKFRVAEKNFQLDYQKWIQEKAEIQNKLSEYDLSPKKNLTKATESDFTFDLKSSKDSGSDESLECQIQHNSLTSIDYIVQGKKQPKRASNDKARTTVNSKKRFIEEVFESSFSEFSINESNENGGSLYKCLYRSEFIPFDSQLNDIKDF